MFFGSPVFWRETHKPARFFLFEGRVVLVLLLMILHIRLWTFLLAVGTMFVFWAFERRGISADAILRYIKSSIIGSKRSARGRLAERSPVDFWFEAKPYLRAQERQVGVSEPTTATSNKQRGGLSRLLKAKT